MLVRHGAGEAHLAPARLVVVAHVKPGFGGQVQHLVDRAVLGVGVTAGKVAARGAVVRHEERVADEGGGAGAVADDIGHAGRRMAWRMHGPRLQPADGKGLAVVQQAVELAAVAAEITASVEDAPEHLLHGGDTAADGDASAEQPLQIRRGRQVVGVNVGLQAPLHRGAQFAHARAASRSALAVPV